MTKEIAKRLIPIFKKSRSRAIRQANECFKGTIIPKNKEARHERKIILASIEHSLLLECWEIFNSKS